MKTILSRSMKIATMTLLIGGLVYTTSANAQSSKYQRPGKKATAVVAPAPGAAVPAADPKAKDAKGEKVDIQQIEQEYWQQKDTDFHVVQNRKFAKEKRPFIYGGYSLLINDSFNRGGGFGLGGGYYYQEQQGFEISYLRFDADNSKTTKEIFSLSGAPTYGVPVSQTAATWNWMPIYGKISLMDKTIIYFDMGVMMGLGLAEYERVMDTGREKDSALMYVLDISQQYFVNEKWAFRFDVKNRFYTQKLKKFEETSPGVRPGKDDLEHSIEALFGLTFYFN